MSRTTNKVIRVCANKEEDTLDTQSAVQKYMTTLLKEIDEAEKQGDEQLYLERVREYFNVLRRSLDIPAE